MAAGRRGQPPSRHTRPRPTARPPRGADHGSWVVAFHGTPLRQNAASILRHGWAAGTGDAHGVGIYFSTQRPLAASYAGAFGAVLKCAIHTRRSVEWNAGLALAFSRWAQARGVAADNVAKSAFLLSRGIRTLRAGSVLVALLPAYRNPLAFKARLPQVKVLEVQAVDGQRIRVA